MVSCGYLQMKNLITQSSGIVYQAVKPYLTYRYDGVMHCRKTRY